MNDKSSELDNFINSQRQQYTTNTQNNIIINSSTEYMGYSKIDNLNGSGIQKSRDFKQKEFEYNVARILYIFSREENTNTEFNFIGKYLSVSGKEYKTFVAEEKAKNRSHIDIANDVAQLGIKPLGETAAKRKMKLD